MGGSLSGIFLRSAKQSGERVVLKLQIYIRDPEKGGVREGQVVVVASPKSYVGALMQLHACKSMTPCTAL